MIASCLVTGITTSIYFVPSDGKLASLLPVASTLLVLY